MIAKIIIGLIIAVFVIILLGLVGVVFVLKDVVLMKRKTIRNKLDKLWADKVKEKGACEYCGKTTYLNAHHFYSRSALSTRWDLDSGFCLCSGCHTLSSKFSAHKTPADFVEWAIETRGSAWYKRIKEKHNQVIKFTNEDLKRKQEELK